jgi:GNAT superfamily N-acetyltransferase
MTAVGDRGPGAGPGVRLEIVAVGFDDPRAAGLLADFGTDMGVRYPGGQGSHASGHDFDPPGTFLLALDAGTPAGCAGLRPHGAGEGEVKRLWVAPAGRGRGTARALLAALVAHARQQGWSRLVLETGLAQPEAIALYESEGWQPVPPYGQYREDSLCRCFALDLAGP